MSFPRYPRYKDSGVAWLGEVPGHWAVIAIKRVCAVVGGSTPKSDQDDYWEGEIIWVTPADLSRLTGFEIHDSMRTITSAGLASCGTTIVPEGSIVLSTRAPIGSLGIAAKALCTNQGCKALVPNGPNSRLLAYILTAANEALNVRGKGTTFLELSSDELGAFLVPLGTAEEQTAIATFLDRETAKIDALVAEQEKLIALLHEKRQAVISHAVTKGLDPNVVMKDSGVEWLGEVPGHWACIRLKQLVIESVAGPYGASLTKAMYAPDGYRVYGQQQVIADDFSVGDYFIADEKYGEMRRYTVFEGDVLVSVMGTIGKVAVVPSDAPPGIINPRLVRYRCGDLIQPRYLQSVLMCQKHQEHLLLESNGTTMDGLNMLTLGRVPIPTPPIDEQTQILKYLKEQAQEFDPLVSQARTAITLLQERRTALISAAVTGQIDVRGLVGSANAPDSIASSAYPASAGG